MSVLVLVAGAGVGCVVEDVDDEIWSWTSGLGLRSGDKDHAHLEGEPEKAVDGSTRDSKRWVEDLKTSSPLVVSDMSGEWRAEREMQQ